MIFALQSTLFLHFFILLITIGVLTIVSCLFHTRIYSKTYTSNLYHHHLKHSRNKERFLAFEILSFHAPLAAKCDTVPSP